MRSISIYLFLFVLTGASLQAQFHQSGSIYFSAGSSFFRNTGMEMPLDLRVDYGINEFFSAGLYFSGGFAIERDALAGWGGEMVNKVRYWYLPGACASVHLGEISSVKSVVGDDMDIYVTGFVGLRYGIVRVPKDPLAFLPPMTRKFRVGATLGLRYELIQPLAIYVEAGYGPTGSLMAGLTYKLGVK